MRAARSALFFLATFLFLTCSDSAKQRDTILPNGEYRFDLAFAEWDDKTMGEHVIVQIKEDSIKIVYEGDGRLSNVKKGQLIDQGIIMKHKTGVWIVGRKQSDTDAEEIGGCSGGPTVIDFRKRKFRVC